MIGGDGDGDGDGDGPTTDSGTGSPDGSVDASQDARVPDPCDLITLPPPPLTHLRLDETTGLTAKDAVGSHHGSLIDIGAASWTSGHEQGALAFDGNDDYVQVGNVGNARTVALWLQASSFGVTTDQTGFRYPTATGNPSNQWTNPTLAYADDGQFSQVTQASSVAPSRIGRTSTWTSPRP